MFGKNSVLRIEFHPEARTDLKKIGKPDQHRIKKALDELARLEDPRQRLLPYSGNLAGFWKLRVGDYRLVCELGDRDGKRVLIIHVAHRGRAYSKRSQRTVSSGSER